MAAARLVLGHHDAHAASAFYPSGFDRAAVLVVDGAGDGVATSLYRADGRELVRLRTYPYTQSLGWFYEAAAEHLGLGEGSSGAGKLMGLAAYGQACLPLDFVRFDGPLDYAIDLTPFGAASCFLYQDIVISLPATLGGSGSGLGSATIPAPLPMTIGTVFTQWIAQDATYALGFAFAYLVFMGCVRVWADFMRRERGEGIDLTGSGDAPVAMGFEGCAVVLAAAGLSLVVAGLFALTGGLPLLLEVAFEVVFAGAVLADDVPKTYDGAGEAFKEGGRELGEGFKSLGRGLKGTFTGEEAKQEYKNSKEIGEGFKDIGRGVAGGARATGENIKDGVDGEVEPSE